MSILRTIYNSIYKSKHRFDDGSILDHYLLGSVIQYKNVMHPNEVLNIPLLYDEQSRLERVDLCVPWVWTQFDSEGDSGHGPSTPLSQSELQDLYKKLEFFTAKSPKWFAPFDIPD